MEEHTENNDVIGSLSDINEHMDQAINNLEGEDLKTFNQVVENLQHMIDCCGVEFVMCAIYKVMSNQENDNEEV